MARKQHFRPTKKTMLIVCEGETEKIYLENLRTFERITEINIKPELPGHRTDCLSMVELAVKQKNDYDLVWCIFDLDTAYKDREKYKKAMDKAVNEKIEIVCSYPCFEVWFLLHFLYTSRGFENCAQVVGLLKKHLADYSKQQTYHLKKNMYMELRPKLMDAVNHSLKLEKYNTTNSIANGTRCDIHKIIEKILPVL